MAAKKKPSLRKYAKTVEANGRFGPGCKTCEAEAGVLESIAEYVEAVDSGDPEFRSLPIASDRGSPSLQSFLLAEFSYRTGPTSLRRHINRCVRGKP